MNHTSTLEIKRSFSGKGVFPHQMAFSLLIPLRNIYLSPQRLIQQIELKEDHTVLELGPGPGYFSLPVAKILTNGKLVLADIQPEMLEYAQKRARKRGLKNIEYYQCYGCSFDLTDSCFDRIYMVTVIGEVENKHACLNEMHRMLKPGGIIAISELAGDPDKMSIEEIRTLFLSHGFSFHQLHGNEKNYTICFKK